MKETKKIEQEKLNDPTQKLFKEDQIRQLSEMVAEQEKEIAKMYQKFVEMLINSHICEKRMKVS